ncbi:MAG: peptidylprolyl isomerase [Bacteroidales bacterium]|jgi:peptidyl-prolyl cis-trans isomerase SurA|nr:peptidylprolyl isomerase [Bacteroidales bacterium]
MRRILNAIFILALTATSTAAFSQKYNNGLVDKTIAIIGNDMIQLSTIEAEVQMMMVQGVTSDKNIRCEILENLLTNKLLLTQARLDSLNVSAENIEGELNNRISQVLTQLGGEKALEEYFKKPLFKLKQEWREAIHEQLLTQEMQRKVAQGAPELTPSDVEAFYDRTPKDSLPIISTQYQIKQIVLYPNKEAAVLAVKERLLEFRERVMKGEKFANLATIYSQDPGSAIKGGELRMASKQLYWPAFSDAAMSLKPGQVSQIVETPDGFHLIQLIERDGDMFNARHILLKPLYTSEDRTTAFAKLDSLRTKIIADSINFETAALRFSQDPKTYINGGLMAEEMSGSSLFEKDLLKPEDYAIIKDMKVGDISEPFESTDNEGRSGNTIYKVLKLVKIVPSHVASFKDDFNILLNEAKNQAALKEIDKFITKKQESTFIRIDPMFTGCEFKREGWIK